MKKECLYTKRTNIFFKISKNTNKINLFSDDDK